MHYLTLRPGNIPGVGSLFVTIKWDGHRLTFTGVAGPLRNGDCRGSSGQCLDEIDQITSWADGWTPEMGARLKVLWSRWHLNDMRAGSSAQESWLRDNPISVNYPESHYKKASAALSKAGLNPDGEYRYGSAWIFEDVPAEIISEIFAFPIADRPNPWGDK